MKLSTYIHRSVGLLAIITIVLSGCNNEKQDNSNNNTKVEQLNQEVLEEIILLDTNSLDYENTLNTALSKLKKTIRLNRRNRSSYVNLARVYSKMGKYEDAIASLDTLVKYHELSPELYVYYGIIYEKKGDKQLATESYSNALALFSENVKNNEEDISSQLGRLFMICMLDGKEKALSELAFIKEDSNKQQYEMYKQFIEGFSRDDFLESM